VAETLGVRGAPILVRLGRWTQLMPQYTIGHLSRVQAVEAALAVVPQITVAGATYRGVGLPDCVAQGRSAAQRVIERLTGSRVEPAGRREMAADPAAGTGLSKFGYPPPGSGRIVKV
jgi:oxygen-dependent protoporphyrinogen oxidase